MRVSARDLYTLRRAQLNAERKMLETQLAQSAARAILLELERRYQLLATEATLDVHTGLITKAAEEASGESIGDESSNTQGPP